mgnify:CR=1 FL=1
MGLSDAVIAEGTGLFRLHVQRLARRESLQAALSADLAAGVLRPQAVQRRAEWLVLEKELDSRSESLRALARFGRSAAGLRAPRQHHGAGAQPNFPLQRAAGQLVLHLVKLKDRKSSCL